jgi:hypothetical protein
VIVLRGSHFLTGLSGTQPIIAISSGEAEFAAQIRGIIEGLFVRNLVVFFEGIEPPVEIIAKKDKSQIIRIALANDSSASRGMLNRLGTSKRTKHISTKLFWAQQLIHHKIVDLEVVKGTENESDIGTKYLEPGVFKRMVALLGLQLLGPTVAEATTTRYREPEHEYDVQPGGADYINLGEETNMMGRALMLGYRATQIAGEATVSARRTVRRMAYLDMDLEVAVTSFVFGAICMLVMMKLWAAARKLMRRCRSTPRRGGDFVTKIALKDFYKTKSGEKMHTEITCQYLQHLSPEELEKMKAGWCTDCKKSVNARGITFLADGV